jgi:hypothetical protein
MALDQLSRRADGARDMERAIALDLQFGAASPAAAAPRAALVDHRTRLARLLHALGDRQGSAAQVRAALVESGKLVGEFPAEPSYAVELGRGHYAFGYLAYEGGEPEAALASLGKSIEVLAAAAAREPAADGARAALRDSYQIRSVVLVSLERFAEALPDMDRTIDLMSAADAVEMRRARARCAAAAAAAAPSGANGARVPPAGAAKGRPTTAPADR